MTKAYDDFEPLVETEALRLNDSQVSVPGQNNPAHITNLLLLGILERLDLLIEMQNDVTDACMKGELQ